MNEAIFWFGALHAAGYAIVGAMWLASFAVNYLIRRTKTKRDILQAVVLIWESRRKAGLKRELNDLRVKWRGIADDATKATGK